MSPGSPGYEPEPLRAALPPSVLEAGLHVHEAIDSTNRRARELAGAGAAHGTLVLAEEQTAGRGREGRSWHSPPGSGVWMSLVVRPDLDPARAGLLPIATGVGVAEAVGEIARVRVGLKWPNDLLVSGRKLAGILVESATQGGRIAWAVLGVGINVSTAPESLPADVRARATSLAREGSHPDRESIVGAVARRALHWIDRVVTDPEDVVEAFAARDALKGRHIRVTDAAGRDLRGIPTGLAHDGALRLNTDQGEILVRTGTVLPDRSPGPDARIRADDWIES